VWKALKNKKTKEPPEVNVAKPFSLSAKKGCTTLSKKKRKKQACASADRQLL